MRVLLATPMLFKSPSMEYLMSVQKTTHLLQAHGILLDTIFVGGDCFVAKARNGLVQSFIDSWSTEYPADVLVFIDDDQSWNAEAFLRMVVDPHEIVCAAVPKKVDAKEGEPQTYNNVILDMDANNNCYVENGLLRISQIGSGFMMIKRSAIEKLIKAYPQRYSPGDGGSHQLHYALFDAKIVWDEKNPEAHGQFWGEDLIFCQKWKKLGEHMWLDPNVEIEHIGRKSYSGNFLQFLQKHANVELTQQTITIPVQLPANVPIPETLQDIERLAA